MNALTIEFIGIAIILVLALALLKKLSNKIKDLVLKMDFFDQKLDSENEKILTTMNQQYTDILTNVKDLGGKVIEEKEFKTEELYEQAKEVVIESGRASASLIQRRLRVGFAQAAMLLDKLEENGIVGPADGVKPRTVLILKEEEEV